MLESSFLNWVSLNFKQGFSLASSGIVPDGCWRLRVSLSSWRIAVRRHTLSRLVLLARRQGELDLVASEEVFVSDRQTARSARRSQGRGKNLVALSLTAP